MTLRFKQDDGSDYPDWEEKKLGELLDYEQPSKYIVKNTTYNDSFSIPVLTAGKSFILGFSNETNDIFKEVPIILFDDFTTDSRYIDFPFKVKSSAIKILKLKDQSSNLKFVFEMMNNIQTPKGEHKRYWISEYQPISIPYPSLPEQEKIAGFLTAVDDLIADLTKKESLLQKYKIGVMQKIFSQELRFKQDDGSDYPDWEEKKLGDVADCLDNLRVPLNEKERNTLKGNIPYCGANGILDYINKYLIDDNIILLAEDGGNFNEYETKPIAYRMSGKCWINNHAHILKAKPSYDQDLLFFILEHKNILSFLSGGTRQKLNKSEMLKIPINLPKDFKEQQKIATLLSSLDNLIEQTKEKLEKYKELKKSLMQHLIK